jgi:hypothetical protein
LGAARAGGIDGGELRFWWHFVTLFGILCAYFRWVRPISQACSAFQVDRPDVNLVPDLTPTVDLRVMTSRYE